MTFLEITTIESEESKVICLKFSQVVQKVVAGRSFPTPNLKRVKLAQNF